MTVDDGRTLRRYLNGKYGPLDEPGFGGGQPDQAYVDEATISEPSWNPGPGGSATSTQPRRKARLCTTSRT